MKRISSACMLLMLVASVPGNASSENWTGPGECGTITHPNWVTSERLMIPGVGARGRLLDWIDPTLSSWDDEGLIWHGEMKFEHFNADGSATYSYQYSHSMNLGWLPVEHDNTPGTLLFLGDLAEYLDDADYGEPGRYGHPVLGVQDICLNPSSDFSLSGEVTYNKLRESPRFELYIGINAEQFLQLVRTARNPPTRLHYAMGSDSMVLRKELVALPNSRARIFFETNLIEPHTRNYDYIWMVVLFDAQGWEVGRYISDKPLRYYASHNHELLAEMHVTGTPGFMRVFFTRHYWDHE